VSSTVVIRLLERIVQLHRGSVRKVRFPKVWGWLRAERPSPFQSDDLQGEIIEEDVSIVGILATGRQSDKGAGPAGRCACAPRYGRGAARRIAGDDSAHRKRAAAADGHRRENHPLKKSPLYESPVSQQLELHERIALPSK
jgi:hypothetical protein